MEETLPTPLGQERAASTTRARHDYGTREFKPAGYGTARHGISAGPAAGAGPATVATGQAGPAEVAADADGAPDAPDPLSAALEGARREDPEAFRILYRATQPRLLRYLKYLVGSEAEDLASEVWLQVTRDLPKFEGNYDNFRRWVTTIARNRAIDHMRRTARLPEAVPVPVEELSYFAGREDTADRAIESITTDRAITLIGSLPRDQAEAVLLRVVAGLDARGAARVAGKRTGAIRTAAYRGLKRLAKRLERSQPPAESR
jgi:RNA polymerase sigma-70 factor, ECF subfamily